MDGGAAVCWCVEHSACCVLTSGILGLLLFLCCVAHDGVAQAIPETLRAAVMAENEEYEKLHAKWKAEQQMCRLRVFRGGENSLAVLHESKPVQELLEMAHASLATAEHNAVPIERCRLRRFNYLTGVSGEPLMDLTQSLKDAGIKSRSNVALETRGEDEEFPAWVEGGLDVLLVYLREGADSFDFPKQVNLRGCLLFCFCSFFLFLRLSSAVCCGNRLC